jgi:VWFA-related protein
MTRSSVWRLLPALALAVWVGGAGVRAQQAPPTGVPNRGAAPPALLQPYDDTTTLRAAARLVLLDVVVTDGKGKPVQGLKASDFTLLEDGTPQVLSSFEEHVPVTPEAAQAAAAVKLPPNHFTNYDPLPNESAATVFLLDALDTPIQAQMYLRDQMIAYMKNVPPGTKIAIFQLDTQMRVIQNFTSDQEVLREAVSSKRNKPELSPLLGGPMAPDYVRERMRQDILSQGMQGLARYLAAFPGRKNLIWFTGRVPIPVYGPGFNVPFPDMTSFIDDFSKTTDVLTLSRIAVYPVDSRGLQTNPAFNAANGGSGRRGGGMGFETRQFYQHGDLDDVAEATGGKAFYNTNGLKQAIAEVVDTGSNYYTLSYSPANKDWDGSYRKLQVKLAEQGLHLEYRRGYYARNDDAAESRHMAQLQGHRRVLPMPADSKSLETTMAAAMRMGAVAPKDIVFLADVTPAAEVSKAKGDEPLAKDNYLDKKYRKAEYREYQIHYSVNPRQMHLMPSPDLSYHGHLEVVAVVYDDLGQVVNSKSTEAQIDVDEAAYQQILQRGRLGIDQTIAIPVKGNYFLRMGVDDVAGNKVGALEVPVDQIQLGLPQTAAVAKP